MVKKKRVQSEAPTDHAEFAQWFITEYAKQIYMKAMRHLIYNRYSVDDMKHYMVERILEILSKRKADGNPIEEPKIYFRKLIPFWCVEYQRMNGFVFGLPKRPRCPDAEKKICSYGFTYLKTQETRDSDSGAVTSSHSNSLSYIDINTTQPSIYYMSYTQKGGEADETSDAWRALVGHLKKEDADVIEYLFRYNLTVPQAARELGIAVSTAYQRKSRAVSALSGFIDSRVKNDSSSWHILNSVL